MILGSILPLFPLIVSRLGGRGAAGGPASDHVTSCLFLLLLLIFPPPPPSCLFPPNNIPPPPLFSSKRPVFSTCSAPAARTKEVEKQCQRHLAALQSLLSYFSLLKREIIALASVQAIKRAPLENCISLFFFSRGINLAAIWTVAKFRISRDSVLMFLQLPGKLSKNTFDIWLLRSHAALQSIKASKRQLIRQ